MRLLVFGGTAYIERRRIGLWSSHLNTEVLQDRSGLSEERPVFGIGFDSDQPYLVFRKIVPAGDRTYPISVLIEPPRKVWELFQWNVGLLIYTLFETEGAVGDDLLKFPESYHSKDSLNRIFKNITVPESGISHPLGEKTERFLQDFWFGFLTVGNAIALNGVEEYLETRPLPKEMAGFLSNIPETLRFGTGWLIGGSREHVDPFGVGLVLDGQKRANSTAEKQAVQKILAVGAKVREAYEYVEKRITPMEGSKLKEFFKHSSPPEQYIDKSLIKQNLEDLQLLKYLNEQLTAEKNNGSKETADYDRELKTVKRIKDGKGYFVGDLLLFMKHLSASPEVTEARLDFVALFEKDSKFLEAHPELFPEIILRRIKNDKNIPQSLTDQLENFSEQDKFTIPDEKWGEIASKTVELTKDTQSFKYWYGFVRNPSIVKFKTLQQSIENLTHKISLEAIRKNDLKTEDKLNYLLYANDSGAVELEKSAPSNIDPIIDYCLSEEINTENLKKLSNDWLETLIKKPAFAHIKFDKQKIAEHLESRNRRGWKIYSLLIDALNGQLFNNSDMSELKLALENPDAEADENSQTKKNLINELKKWKKSISPDGIFSAPQLSIVRSIFSPDCDSIIADEFFDVKPKLTDQSKINLYTNWLNGWYSFTQNDLIAEKSKKKLNDECLNLFQTVLNMGKKLNINTSSKEMLLKVCQDNVSDWSRLGAQMLSEGEEIQDEQRLKQFDELFIENELELNNAFTETLSKTNSDHFLRRLYSTSGEKIRNFLTTNLNSESQDYLISIFDRYEQGKVAEYKERILKLSNFPTERHLEDRLGKIRTECSNLFSDNIFIQAASEAHSTDLTQNPEAIMLYKALEKYLNPDNKGLSAEANETINERYYEAVEQFLFGEKCDSFANEIREDLLKNKFKYRSYVENSVNKYLDEEKSNSEDFPRKEAIFFDRFVLERSPKLDKEGQADSGVVTLKINGSNCIRTNPTLIDKIFTCLSKQTPLDLQTPLDFFSSFSKNDSKLDEFIKIIFFEYKKCEDIIKGRDEYEGENIPKSKFTPFQNVCLSFLLNLGKHDDEQLTDNFIKIKRHFESKKNIKLKDFEKTLKDWDFEYITKKKSEQAEDPVPVEPEKKLGIFRRVVNFFRELPNLRRQRQKPLQDKKQNVQNSNSGGEKNTSSVSTKHLTGTGKPAGQNVRRKKTNRK